jgi:hypothetical protein
MRRVELVRAAYGFVLLAAPPRALGALARQPLDRPSLRVARVLGARLVAQAVVLTTHPAPRWRMAGAAVDGAHAASMVALARWSRRPVHRRLAARSARDAALLAAAECMCGLQRAGPGN